MRCWKPTALRKCGGFSLLETSIDGASGVIFNVTGGPDLTLYEVNEAAEVIYAVASPEANIIFGAVIDERVQGEIRITVIATGFDGARHPRRDAVTTHKVGETKNGTHATVPTVAPTPAMPATSHSAPAAADKPVEPYTAVPGSEPLDIPPFLRPHR